MVATPSSPFPSTGVFYPPTLESEARGPVPNAPAQAGTAQTDIGESQENQTNAAASSARPGPVEQSSLPWPVQGVIQQLTGYFWAATPSVPDLSSLYVPEPGSLATNPEVRDALFAHAQAAGTALSRETIQKYVALGERAVRAIEQPATETGQPLTQALGVVLTPNIEVVRAICWFVVACAAQQDVNQQASGVPRMIGTQEITDLSIAGSYVFNDPNHAIYDFMQKSSLSGGRVSTHFNEISASPLSFVGQPWQSGIEDFERRLPGENGALLFDRLEGEAGQKWTFMKFENAGVPTLSNAWTADDRGQGRGSFWEIGHRLMSHAVSFAQTRHAGEGDVNRKEHVHKGLLKESVYDPFIRVVKAAEESELLEPGMNGEQHAQRSKKGFPHLDATLTQLKATINEEVERVPSLRSGEAASGDYVDV